MLCIAATGCVRDIDDTTHREEDYERKPASLSITMHASDIYQAAIETRNMIDPDGNAAWTGEDSLADGRTIRRITVFLVDDISKEMVAYRHIIYNGEDADVKPIHMPLLHTDDAPQGGNGFVNTDPASDNYGKVDLALKRSSMVRLTFNYDNPLHGNVERLKHGKYALIAMANYADLPLSEEDIKTADQAHASVRDKNGFVREIHSIIHRFYGSTGTDDDLNDPDILSNNGIGIENFDFKQENLYKYKLNVAYDETKDPTDPAYKPYIRKKLDELPLYTLAYIDLQPGENFITDPISLYRTYARVRIEVKNYSEELLSVSKLSFSKNFSKDKTFLCRMPGAADIFDGLDYEQGAPVVSYGESIIAFPYYLTIDHRYPDWKPGPETERHYIVENDDPLYASEVGKGQEYIKKGQTAAIFDAYISASRLDNYPNDKYYYTIELGYPNVKQSTIASSPATTLGQITSAEGIAICDKDAWLYESTKGEISFLTMSNDEMAALVEKKDSKGVWVLETNGTKGYYIRNLSTNQYLTVSRSGFWNYTYSIGLSLQKSSAETFTIVQSGSGFALQSTAYSGRYVTSSTTMSSSANYFSMYPYEQKAGGMSTSKTIYLQTIDSQTAAVTDVTEINRNDFLNILVEVSYNPDRGDFDFAAHSWFEDHGGDITFN